MASPPARQQPTQTPIRRRARDDAWQARESELQAAREQAERDLRGKMRFFAAASHDLRQPMQAIALFASALESHVPEQGQARTILQSLKTSLAAMEELFDSLLDMSRIEAGVMRSEAEPVFVNDLLEQAEAEFAGQAAAKGLELRVVPSSAVVMSDPTHLARILRNLLSNAIRYTDKGRVLVGCRRQGKSLRIEVADSGIGIPDDQRRVIFEEFVQGRVAQSEKGVGLGLAIVKGLARMLGHGLDLRSQPGKGSCFSVTVPLADSDIDYDDDDEDAGLSSDLRGLTVVVVDDDADIRDGLSILLDAWGCKVAAGSTGDEAWSALQTVGGRADVILADLGLRNAHGAEETITALHQRLGAEVPTFVFTGDTDPAAAIGYPVLLKPINPVRLRRVLAEATGRH